MTEGVEGPRVTLTLLFLHIAVMFLAIAVHTGSQLFAWIALRWGPPGSLVGVVQVYGRLGTVVPVLFIVGGVLGLATAFAFGYSLLAPWLVIAYVGFVVAAAYASRVSAPTINGLAGDAAIDTNRVQLIIAGDAAIVATLIADMVFKPFS
jgi:hypothetical protein